MARAKIGRARLSRRRQAQEIMDRIHWDLMGPINISLHGTQKETARSLGGNLWVLVMVDEYSRYVVVMPLRSKGDAADALLNMLTFIQTQTRLVAKEVHGDGGTEIYNAKVRAFLTSQGTTFDATPADSPALNGIAERMNHTLMEMTRAMLIQSEAHVSL